MPFSQYAFVSAYEKAGLEDLAPAIHSAGFEIVSLGGTAAVIEDLKIEDEHIPVIASDEFIDHGVSSDLAESMDARELREITAAHLAQHMSLDNRDLLYTNRASIDLVYVNLMPPKLVIDEEGRAGYHRDKGGELMLHAAMEGSRIVLTSPGQIRPYVYHFSHTYPFQPATENYRRLLAFEAHEYLIGYAEQVSALGRLGVDQLEPR